LAVDVEEIGDPSKNNGSDNLFKISTHSNQRRGDDTLLHNYQNGSLTATSGKPILGFFSSVVLLTSLLNDI
jgi:molybdenum cofactor sulfurtransferase